MLFLFCLADCETGAYISHDPMFKDVSGYQSGVDFLTAGMIKKMTKQIKKAEPEFKGLGTNYDSLQLREFVYSYAECMEECEQGESSKGTVVVHVLF